MRRPSNIKASAQTHLRILGGLNGLRSWWVWLPQGKAAGSRAAAATAAGRPWGLRYLAQHFQIDRQLSWDSWGLLNCELQFWFFWGYLPSFRPKINPIASTESMRINAGLAERSGWRPAPGTQQLCAGCPCWNGSLQSSPHLRKMFNVKKCAAVSTLELWSRMDSEEIVLMSSVMQSNWQGIAIWPHVSATPMSFHPEFWVKGQSF